jgi:hypothetical protein
MQLARCFETSSRNVMDALAYDLASTYRPESHTSESGRRPKPSDVAQSCGMVLTSSPQRHCATLAASGVSCVRAPSLGAVLDVPIIIED